MRVLLGQDGTGTAFSITAGTREIRVSGLTNAITPKSVTLIFSEAQRAVLASTGKANITTTLDGDDWVIDYSGNTGTPVLVAGDASTLRMLIEQADETVNESITADRYVVFTGAQTTFTLVSTGILSDLGGATDPVLNGTPITIPYPVMKDDRLQLTGIPGETVIIKTIKTNSTDPTVDTGQLGGKVIQQGVNGAIYSNNLNKVIILGRGVFDEDEKFVIGDGAYLIPLVSHFVAGRYKGWIEDNGYLYMFSYEGLKLIRVDLLTKQITDVQIVSSGYAYVFTQVAKVGNYIYYSGYTSAGWIDVNTLATGNLTLQNSGNELAYPVVKSSTSYFVIKSTSLNKIVGTSVTFVTVLNGPIAYHDGYVYVCNGTSVQKVRESDLGIVATITTNPSGTVIRNEVHNGFLYTLYTTGVVTEIDLSTFVSPARTITTGYGVTKPDFFAYNGHLYFITQNGSSFMDITISSGAYAETPLQNSHNSINVDEVNNRLIFFSQLDTINTPHLKPVEIIQL